MADCRDRGLDAEISRRLVMPDRRWSTDLTLIPMLVRKICERDAVAIQLEPSDDGQAETRWWKAAGFVTGSGFIETGLHPTISMALCMLLIRVDDERRAMTFRGYPFPA